MRKFFLIPLVALFTCVNVWATEPERANVKDKHELDSVLLVAATVDSMEITLTANIEFETTVAMVTNATEFNKVTIPSTAHVLLNLNGFGIQHTFTFTMFVAYAGDIDRNALIHNKGTLHVISQGNRITQLAVQEKGEGHLGNSTTFCNDSLLIIDGGVFVGPHEAMKLPVIWNRTTTATTIINGGTFLCDESVSDYNNGPDFGPLSGGGTWIIKGGIFSTNEMVGVSHVTSKKSTKQLFEEHATAAYTLQPGYTAIEVPYTNANIKGYDSWRTDAVKNSAKCVIDTVNPENPYQTYYRTSETTDKETHDGFRPYQRYRFVVKPVCVVVPTGDNNLVVSGNDEKLPSATTTKNFVYVKPGAKLTVGQNEKLRVNSTSGIILGGTDAKLVVAPGATVISDGDIITSSNDNIELTMDARNNQYSTLAIKANNIQAKHPNATVTLMSVCERSGSTYRWQRFAIPTYQTNMAVSSFVNDETTRVFGWNYDDTGATDGAWQEKSSSDILVPFQGYTMTTMTEGAHPDYTFQCELVGNGNPRIALHPNWNYLANSYTAPLYLDAVLDYLISAENIAVNAGVWAQIEPGTSNWKAISYADVIFGEMPLHKINPMQAFIFSKKAESLATTLDIMYEEYVYTPLTNGTYAAAPRRAPQLNEDITRANIVVKADDNQTETVKLYLSNDFSDSYDNGFDLEKYKNAENFNLYIASPALGDLERIATNNLDNTSITIQTLSAESYTMTFESVTLNGYSIIDNVTKTVTEIKAGNQYEFTAAANSTHTGRFTIILTEDPTAVENVEDAKHIVNGIYSITGVYMGTNFNVLPAGIYVVNGKKVVK